MRFCVLILIIGVVLAEGKRSYKYDTLLKQAVTLFGGKDVQQPAKFAEINPTQNDFNIKTEDGNQSEEVAVDSTEDKNFAPYDVEESQDIEEESDFQKSQSPIRKFYSMVEPTVLLKDSEEPVLVPAYFQVPDEPFISQRKELFKRQFYTDVFGFDKFEREEIGTDVPELKKLIEDLAQKIKEASLTLFAGQSLQQFLTPGFCVLPGATPLENPPGSSIDTSLPSEIPSGAPPPVENPIDVPFPPEIPIDAPLPIENPSGSPLPPVIPVDVPLPIENPIGSPLPPVIPVDVPLPTENPIGSSLPPEVPSGAPLPPEIPIDSPLPVENPISAPLPGDISIGTILPDNFPVSALLPGQISNGSPPPAEIPSSETAAEVIPPVRIKQKPPTVEDDSELTKLLVEYFIKQKQKEEHQRQQQLKEEKLQMQQLLQQQMISPEGFLSSLSNTGSNIRKPSAGVGPVVPISNLHGLLSGGQISLNQLLGASGLGGLANVPPGLMIGLVNSPSESELPGGMKPVSQLENRPSPVNLFGLTGGLPSSFLENDNKKDSNKVPVQLEEKSTATVDELLEVIESLQLHSSTEKKLAKFFKDENRNDLNDSDRYKLIRFLKNLERKGELLTPESLRRHFDEQNLRTELSEYGLSRSIAGEFAEALWRRFGKKGPKRKRPSIPIFGAGERNKFRDSNRNRGYGNLRQKESGKRTRYPRQEDSGNVNIAGFENSMITEILLKKRYLFTPLLEINVDFNPLSLQLVGAAEGTPAVAELLMQLKFDLLLMGLFSPTINLKEFNVKKVNPEDVMLAPCTNLSEAELQVYVDEIVDLLNDSSLRKQLESLLNDLLQSSENAELYAALEKLVDPEFPFA